MIKLSLSLAVLNAILAILNTYHYIDGGWWVNLACIPIHIVCAVVMSCIYLDEKRWDSIGNRYGRRL